MGIEMYDIGEDQIEDALKELILLDRTSASEFKSLDPDVVAE